MAGNYGEMLDLIHRRRSFGASPTIGSLRELGMLQIQGKTAEAIRHEESYLELYSETSVGSFNEAYLAAIQGDYDKANQWANKIEEIQGDGRPGIYLLWIYNETGEEELLRAQLKKIEAWPAGSTMFANVIYQFGYSLPFDLADTPKFSAQLEQAGIDLDSFSLLPRLSKIRETKQ